MPKHTHPYTEWEEELSAPLGGFTPKHRAPKHARITRDDRSRAECRCGSLDPGFAWCPRHHAAPYALCSAKHRKIRGL